MYVHSSGLSFSVNGICSVTIILVSIANLIGSKMIKKFKHKFEVVQLGCFLGLATQLIYSLFIYPEIKLVKKIACTLFPTCIFINISPLLISIIMDFILCMFFCRENSLIIRIITSIVLIVYTYFISRYTILFYNWELFLAMIIISSFFITLCLPSKNEKNEKLVKHKRIRAFIGSMILAITMITVMKFFFKRYSQDTENFINSRFLSFFFHGLRKWTWEKTCSIGETIGRWGFSAICYPFRILNR